MKWHFILSALFLPIPAFAAQQDLRRCVNEDGSVVFTDKSCPEGDIEKPAYQSIPNKSTLKRRYPAPPSCNRTADDLLYSVRTAVDMRDANLLASHYHWVGVSSPQAEGILDRLELLVANPLTDIRLLQGQETADTQSHNELDTELEAPDSSHKKSQAYALKLVQYQPKSNNMLHSTVFKLQQYYGCYWIRF